MKLINKYLLIVLIGFLLMIPALTTQAFSLGFDPTIGGQEDPLKTATKLGNNDPAYVIFNVVNTSLIFLGTITLVMIIAAGFMWLLAGGVEEKITKAKELLQGAVIGLVIVLSSYGLAQYIFYALTTAITGGSGG